MKKLFSKKVLAALLGLVVALGVVDLTVLENSRLKPIFENLQEAASSVAPVQTGASDSAKTE